LASRAPEAGYVFQDSFINLAKQGLAKYEESQNGGQGQQNPQDDQGGYSKTGGEEYNSPHHADGGRPNPQQPNFDLNESHVVDTAKEHGTGDDNDLFSQGLSFVKSKLGGGGSHEIDEDHVQNAHAEAYQKGNSGSLPASALGSAAALQALKSFTSGGSSSSSGGNSQSKLVGLAMAEASKLFDSNGASGGSKQDAVNGAAETVIKLLVKSKFKSAIGGGDSGGLGGLASLAGKFI